MMRARSRSHNLFKRFQLGRLLCERCIVERRQCLLVVSIPAASTAQHLMVYTRQPGLSNRFRREKKRAKRHREMYIIMEMATPQFSRFLFFFLIPMAVHTAAAVFWEKKREKVKWFFLFLCLLLSFLVQD